MYHAYIAPQPLSFSSLSGSWVDHSVCMCVCSCMCIGCGCEHEAALCLVICTHMTVRLVSHRSSINMLLLLTWVICLCRQGPPSARVVQTTPTRRQVVDRASATPATSSTTSPMHIGMWVIVDQTVMMPDGVGVIKETLPANKKSSPTSVTVDLRN